MKNLDRPGRANDDFDRLLGPADQRYLGRGHERVRHSLSNVLTSGVGEFRAAGAVGTAEYPEDWSVKAGQTAREAHLSTLDAIRFSEMLCAEMLSVHLQPERLLVRAGATASSSIDAVPLTGCAERVESGNWSVSSRIGPLRVEVGGAEQTHPVPAENADVPRTYVRDFDVDAGRIRVVSADGARTNALAFVPCLLLTAQMSQVLLYGGDPKRRSASENLWMRWARFERLDGDMTVPPDAELRIVSRRTFPREAGLMTAIEVRSENAFGVQVNAGLAYFVPDADATASSIGSRSRTQ